MEKTGQQILEEIETHYPDALGEIEKAVNYDGCVNALMDFGFDYEETQRVLEIILI